MRLTMKYPTAVNVSTTEYNLPETPKMMSCFASHLLPSPKSLGPSLTNSDGLDGLGARLDPCGATPLPALI